MGTTSSANTTEAVPTSEPATTGPIGDCGNGQIEPGEACDDGPDNAPEAMCTPECQVAVCGDDYVCTACGEECEFGSGCYEGCKWSDRYAFVSSELYAAAELGGLAGADALCDELAHTTLDNDGRTFIAWLSSSSADARDRLGTTPVPYVLTDGHTRIAADTAALLSGTLDAPINLDEFGPVIADDEPVWTNTRTDGTRQPGGTACDDWTGDVGTAQVGLTSAIDAAWTDSAARDCGVPAHLYCVQIIP